MTQLQIEGQLVEVMGQVKCEIKSKECKRWVSQQEDITKQKEDGTVECEGS